MSLRKDHLAKNDFSCHSRIKGGNKQAENQKLRRRLNASEIGVKIDRKLADRE